MPYDERPPKLPLASTCVVWASLELSMPEKVVWYHDWALDQGGSDGAYISTVSMGKRLGLAARTVESARNHLKLLGLHVPLRRRDARNLGWVATLPAECRPVGARAAGPEAERLAAALDAHIRAREAWRANQRGHTTAVDAVRPRQPAQAAATALGGRGGELQPLRQSEAQLPPRDTDQEGGVASAEAGRMEETSPGSDKASGNYHGPGSASWDAMKRKLRGVG